MKKQKTLVSALVVLIGMSVLILSGCSGFFNQVPVVVLDCNPVIAQEGDWVNFDGTRSEDPDGEVVQYFWDFGPGGVTDDNGMASVFYPEAGTFNVSLTVMDDDGALSSQDILLEVLPRGNTGSIGYHDPKVGVYLWVENPETGEKITGTTPIFDSINQHLTAYLDLPQGAVCDIYVVCASDPDYQTADKLKQASPMGVIDWPNHCFASTQGISRVRAEIRCPDGVLLVRDTNWLNFDLSEPMFNLQLIALGNYDVFIEVWDPTGYSWAEIHLNAKSCPDCF